MNKSKDHHAKDHTSVEEKIKIALEEIKKTFKVKETEAIKELRADLASNVGVLYSKKQDFQNALKYLRMALIEYEKLNMPQKKAAVQGSLGALHLNNEDYQLALKFYKNAYDFWKNTTFLNERIVCLQHIGFIYLKFDDEVTATEYLLNALQKTIDLQDEDQFAYTIQILLEYYENHKRYDMLLELKRKALEFWQKMGLKKRQFKTLIDLGVISQVLEDQENALNYFKSAFNLAYHNNNLEDMFLAQGFIAEVLVSMEEIEKAKKTYLQAYKLAVYINAQKNYKQHVDEMKMSLLALGMSKKTIVAEGQKALREAEKDQE